MVQLGREMEACTRRSLVTLLQEYWDVVAFGLEEMLGIDLAFMEHRLNIIPYTNGSFK